MAGVRLPVPAVPRGRRRCRGCRCISVWAPTNRDEGAWRWLTASKWPACGARRRLPPGSHPGFGADGRAGRSEEGRRGRFPATKAPGRLDVDPSMQRPLPAWRARAATTRPCTAAQQRPAAAALAAALKGGSGLGGKAASSVDRSYRAARPSRQGVRLAFDVKLGRGDGHRAGCSGLRKSPRAGTTSAPRAAGWMVRPRLHRCSRLSTSARRACPIRARPCRVDWISRCDGSCGKIL